MSVILGAGVDPVAACLGSSRGEVDLHQRALGDGGVEVAGAGADPVGGPDSGLHGSRQALLGRRDRRVQLVAVRRTKNQDVDVADSTVAVPPPRKRAAQDL